MKYFDIFRHAEDDEKGVINNEGEKQLFQLVDKLKQYNKKYYSFITSPYPRCIYTLEFILTKLQFSEKLIFCDVKLCTPFPSRWNKLFYQNKFQNLLPKIGSKYLTAQVLDKDLILADGKYFIKEIEKYATLIPEATHSLGISHNTMILSAASIIAPQKIIEINGCEGIQFILSKNKIISCKQIK